MKKVYLALCVVTLFCAGCDRQSQGEDWGKVKAWIQKAEPVRFKRSQKRERESFDSEEQYAAWRRYCALQLKADEAYAEADPVVYGEDGPPGPSEEYLRAQLAP